MLLVFRRHGSRISGHSREPGVRANPGQSPGIAPVPGGILETQPCASARSLDLRHAVHRLGPREVVVRLQIDPELRRRAERLGEEPGGLGADPTLALYGLVDANAVQAA